MKMMAKYKLRTQKTTYNTACLQNNLSLQNKKVLTIPQ